MNNMMRDGNIKSINLSSRLLFPVVIFLALIPDAVFGQETILHAYQQNFIRSGLEAKVEILTDAATDEQAENFIGPLYNFAL